MADVIVINGQEYEYLDWSCRDLENRWMTIKVRPKERGKRLQLGLKCTACGQHRCTTTALDPDGTRCPLRGLKRARWKHRWVPFYSRQEEEAEG